MIFRLAVPFANWMANLRLADWPANLQIGQIGRLVGTYTCKRWRVANPVLYFVILLHVIPVGYFCSYMYVPVCHHCHVTTTLIVHQFTICKDYARGIKIGFRIKLRVRLHVHEGFHPGTTFNSVLETKVATGRKCVFSRSST